MARRPRDIRLPAPYLKRIWLDADKKPDPDAYPFSLPLFRKDFELTFERPITILVGENGTGKSTLLEGIAALAGYDQAGGRSGHRAVNHSSAVEIMGDRLRDALKAAWLPKISRGWFFRAESFFSVARYLDEAALSVGAPPPDFLSHSHGEGFIRFFDERCRSQGVFIFDEPESALSPSRQLDFLKLLHRMHESAICQVIMATHSPILMAYPNAQLLQITRGDIYPVQVQETEHFRQLRDFCADPAGFVETALWDSP